jgi:hypothetical protein
MRIPGLFFLLVILSSWYRAGDPAEPAALFPVYEKGQYGFVNEKGRMWIKPRFQQVGPFRNGLAPVRENTHFGYINTQGQYAIEPQFDEAMPFSKAYAAVWKQGRKYLIDRAGEIQFDHQYRDWRRADREDLLDRLIVTAEDGRQGLIDRRGKIVLEAVYDRISPFSEGMTTVARKTIGASGEAKTEVAAFNLEGEIVVSFGRFDAIGAFKNGYALVSQERRKNGQIRKTTGVINAQGEVQFLLKDKHIDLIDSEQMYQEGLAEIAIYTVDRDTLASDDGGEVYAYRGMIDPEGKIVFSHPQVEDITPFEHGRAFAKTAGHSWVLIDRKGKRVGKDYYQNVPDHGFEDGSAVVSLEEGLGLINTDGQLLLPAVDLNTTYYQRVGDVVFYEVELLEKKDKTYVRRWGFWDLQTGYVQPPDFDKVDVENGFQQSLVQVEEDGRQGYVSRDGKYVWRAARR